MFFLTEDEDLIC